MANLPFERLRVYQMSEALSDEVWKIVRAWNSLERDTVGKQLVRAVDSIGANLAEGSGRGSLPDNRRFIRIARGSFYEARHWLRRAYRRQLLTEAEIDRLRPLLEDLGPTLNAYLRSIGRQAALPEPSESSPPPSQG